MATFQRPWTLDRGNEAAEGVRVRENLFNFRGRTDKERRQCGAKGKENEQGNISCLPSNTTPTTHIRGSLCREIIV